MNTSLIQSIRKLRLSGMLESLEVRLAEASGIGIRYVLAHAMIDRSIPIVIQQNQIRPWSGTRIEPRNTRGL